MDDPASRTAQALDIFSQVVELDRDARAAALDRLCSDAELRAEVEALLSSDAETTLPDPPTDRLLAALTEAPERFGPFTVLDELGRGGMGVVYRARQERPDRVVALKVLGGRRLSDAARRRFELEVELLGRLDHEGIARIHAAGAEATDGADHPWFAMEFVDGRPLVEHGRGLTVRERLALFAAVCDAVEHAHRHGVVHRDLKSANVLVTPDGRPKVLDFGIARSLDADVELTATSGLTLDGQVLGTVSTMSPEQARGEVAAIDTRTDVYALGVLLHQLLVDRLPLELEGAALPEALRRIVEDVPAPVSSHDPTLAGDLDVIVAKALEKDPAARYRSVGELADDVRRHLEHRPILASPPDTLDRLARFARRHRVLVGAGAVLVSGLAVASVVSFAYYRDAVAQRSVAEDRRRDADARRVEAEDARRAADEERQVAEAQRELAERERDRVEQLYRFVRGTFDTIDPNVVGTREVTVREIVDAASVELDADPPDDPTLRADMHALLGEIYGDLSLLDETQRQYERLVAIAEEHGVETVAAPQLARAYADLARVALLRVDYDRAEVLYRGLIDLVDARDDVDPNNRAVGLQGLAYLPTHPLEQRLAWCDEALAVVDSVAQPSLTFSTRLQRVTLLDRLGRDDGLIDELDALVELALEDGRPSLVVHAVSERASRLASRLDPRAFDDYRDVAALLDDVLGRDHPQTYAHLLDVSFRWADAGGGVPDVFRDRIATAAADLALRPSDVSPAAWRQVGVLCMRVGDVDGMRTAAREGLASFADDLAALDAGGRPFDAQTASLVSTMLELRAEVADADGDVDAVLADAERVRLLDASPGARLCQFALVAAARRDGIDVALAQAELDAAALEASGELDDAAQVELAAGLLALRGGERRADGVALLERGIARLADVSLADDSNLAEAYVTLGAVALEDGDPERALGYLEPLTDVTPALAPHDAVDALGRLSMAHLALARAGQDDHADPALVHFARTVSRRRAITPQDFDRLAIDLANHAMALGHLGYDEACVRRFDEALREAERAAADVRASIEAARARFVDAAGDD